MINPLDAKEFKALAAAVTESKRKLAPFREKRRDLISLAVGSEYTDDNEVKSVYLNLMNLATNIYVRQCAVRAPTAKITSPYAELRPMAMSLRIACKEVAAEAKLGQTLRRAVTEALFSPKAVVKVGLEHKGTTEYNGEEDVDVTDPYVNMVSFDDYVVDMSARSAYDPAFEGDTYYLTKQEILDRYPKAKGLDLTADELSINSESGEERAEGISHSQQSGDDNLHNKIIVQDVWLIKERKLVTYLPSKPTKALKVVPYDIGEDGPYHSLWFTDVLDNAMPLPAFSVLKNLQMLANSLFRRLASQAKNKKSVVGFSNEESAKNFSAAKDGSGVFWTGQEPKNIDAGGIDPQNMALLIQVKDMFSWAANNLDSLGGLSAMSETASQDKAIGISANAQLADMQDATALFAEGIFRKLALYEWTNPIRERILQKEIPGSDVTIPVEWTPETRQGDFLLLNFAIVQSSMREDNPGQKVQKLKDTLMNVFTPLQPFMQEQGLTVDVKRFTQLVADYDNIPELEQVIVSMDPNMREELPGPAGNPTPSGKPANTNRTYTRVNKPGATRQGKDAALVQTLMGAGVQDAEGAAMTRGVT